MIESMMTPMATEQEDEEEKPDDGILSLPIFICDHLI